MSKVAVVTDSTAYIPDELLKKLNHLCCSSYRHLGRSGL